MTRRLADASPAEKRPPLVIDGVTYLAGGDPPEFTGLRSLTDEAAASPAEKDWDETEVNAMEAAE